MDQSEQTTFKGLSTIQAEAARRQFGPNTLKSEGRNALFITVLNIVREPMFILLGIACVLYFFLGDLPEAIMMMVSIAFVTGIELYQEHKSDRAIEALRAYTETKVRVLRDGKWTDLESAALVPEDIVSIEEGERLPADGILLAGHDLSVDESVMTGESLPVEKEPGAETKLFQGTTIAGGKGVFQVKATGNSTEFGKLGRSIESIDPAPTPLQIQIRQFVRYMGYVGGAAFLLVFGLNFWAEHDIWKALLFSLTLAMSILPQEIPVAFSTFMALGAFRMIKMGILAKQPKTVESLGSATVICLDKTGTITENEMTVAEVTNFSGRNITLETSLWASEPEPFDPMEKAILVAVQNVKKIASDPRKGFHIVREYPLSGKPPMMTHIWENDAGIRIAACKGGVEKVLEVSKLPEKDRLTIQEDANKLASKGYRVLAVASAEFEGNDFYPEQDAYAWRFEGLLALFDPPKPNALKVFKKFRQAGIRVVMITGDHAETARNIATQTGLTERAETCSGTEIMGMTDDVLAKAVQSTDVFARMFPEAKLRVVQALKAGGEIVAMSGDGVNDGPALKAAQIGVAMGKKGTDIARSAASLVLLTDNLNAMVKAVKTGRRIYANLRKAIRYIISIHLPIVLMVLLPLLLGWPYTHILLPLHVIFLELVMDPTAAVAFEDEPAESNLMRQAPHKGSRALFTRNELMFSLLQGGIIAVAVLGMYQVALFWGMVETGVRAIVFTTMVCANLFLTLVNRSFEFPITKTLFYPNRTLPYILALSMILLAAILYIPFLAQLFRVQALSLGAFMMCLLAGVLSTMWFEVWKLLRVHGF
ncbi:MAG: cation-translocating P-type ATPase [Bacteroidota bacterium]